MMWFIIVSPALLIGLAMAGVMGAVGIVFLSAAYLVVLAVIAGLGLVQPFVWVWLAAAGLGLACGYGAVYGWRFVRGVVLLTGDTLHASPVMSLVWLTGASALVFLVVS